MPKKGEYVKFKSSKVPEDNEKQNPEEYYRNKYQKSIACSCSCKLNCVDYKFTEPFKTDLGKDAVY